MGLCFVEWFGVSWFCDVVDWAEVSIWARGWAGWLRNGSDLLTQEADGGHDIIFKLKIFCWQIVYGVFHIKYMG